MTRSLRVAGLALAAFAALAAVGPEAARAQYYYRSYYAPVVAPSPVVTTSYYAPPAYSYSLYPAPVTTYSYYPGYTTYSAPAYATYSAPAYTTYSAPVYSYYPAYTTYSAPVTAYYGPYATSSYYMRPGLFRPRVWGTTSYYTPMYYRY